MQTMALLHESPGLRKPGQGFAMIYYLCHGCQTLYSEDFSWPPGRSLWTFPGGHQQSRLLTAEEARTKLAEYRAVPPAASP